MNMREQKGQQIASRSSITRRGGAWLVPSQSGGGKYIVDYDPEGPRCNCPDYETRRMKCKHIYAVEITIRRTKSTVTETKADGTTQTTVTETVKVTRKTYKQEWPAYNKAQTEEKRLFLYLLRQLCEGVGGPAQHGAGRRFLPLEDMIFAMAYKVYSTVSGRRFMTDLRDAHAKGYISQVPSYNSIFNYFDSEMLTDYLKMLIEESSLPLKDIESKFALDSSGLSTCRFIRWMEVKHGGKEDWHDWVKVHVMTGVKTNIVTSVEVTHRYANDSPHFKPLLQTTVGNGFTPKEVSADKGYDSFSNRCFALERGAVPYIPFRETKEGASPSYKGGLWRRMYHFYKYKQEEFARHYHKRSNVETTFMMIKAKFGDSLRSKTKTAQINEALCKVLCHNICCVIQSIHELNLKPKFYQAT